MFCIITVPFCLLSSLFCVLPYFRCWNSFNWSFLCGPQALEVCLLRSFWRWQGNIKSHIYIALFVCDILKDIQTLTLNFWRSLPCEKLLRTTFSGCKTHYRRASHLPLGCHCSSLTQQWSAPDSCCGEESDDCLPAIICYEQLERVGVKAFWLHPTVCWEEPLRAQGESCEKGKCSQLIPVHLTVQVGKNWCRCNKMLDLCPS